jgi:hypothetical protein
MAVIEGTDMTRAASWSVGGRFLESLATRDFGQMAGTLDPEVRFRALLPRGPVEWSGPSAVTDAFRTWFGQADDFQVVDAAVGAVADRLHLTWRLRLRPAPRADGWHVIEQQVYADITNTIEALDLLCSGFRAEGAASIRC